LKSLKSIIKGTVKGTVSKVPGSSKAGNWISKRREKSKENEKRERAKETFTLKVVTFVFTLAAMMLGLSFIPLFPQPLPMLLAVLIAFVTFKSPRIGMPVGTTLIGIGLMYHLAELNFIAYMGAFEARVGFVAIWMVLFIATPIFYHRYKSAIAIDLGIIAAMILFFEPIYFLVIPIILTSAVFLKKNVVSTAIYYILIALPLQVYQYYSYILTISQPEWWKVAGSSPPLILPLSDIFEKLQSSMTQFRLFDTSQFVYKVYQQFFINPDVSVRNLQAAFIQYLDSFPGIFMFLVILAGIILAYIFFAKMFVKEIDLPYSDALFAPVAAIVTTVLFYVMLSILATPLAFNANADLGTLILATISTTLLTVPLAIITYSPKENATGEMIIARAKELKDELNDFKSKLNEVKAGIPVNVSSPEGKMVIINDKLDDILKKALSSFFAESSLDRLYQDLDKKVSKEIKELLAELNTVLSEYQLFISAEYSDWSGKLKDAGIKVSHETKFNYQKEMPLGDRIHAIQEILLESRNMANDVFNTAEPIYDIIRALYDPEMPEESQVINYAREKLHQQAIFHAISGLFSALMNWKKLYGEQVEESIERLNKSLNPIIDLGKSQDSLAPLIGDKLPSIIADAKRAETIKKTTEKTKATVLNLIILRDMLDLFVETSKDALSVLFEEIKEKEQIIEDLSPAEDSFWSKNATLRDRMTDAIQELYNPKSQVSQIMLHLPKYLDYIDEAVQTLTSYNDRKELLLNYPMAEAAILEQLKTKSKLTPEDQPFQQRYAQEYLRLFYMARFSQFSYDSQNAWLIKKD
jgi:hypothetical protein